MNLEFNLETPTVIFHAEDLNPKLKMIDERAIRRSQRYLVAEGELLESIVEVDQNKIYEKFGFDYLTTYCVQRLKLDETVAGVLVRVARKGQIVPELKQAVIEGEISISNARTIASVITKENHSEWIGKAKQLSKHKLAREVASVSPSKAKPEKARHVGNGRVQITLNLSEEEYDRRLRVKDLVGQSKRKGVNDSEVEVAMIECYEFHKDPVRKAERAAKRSKNCKEKDASRNRSTSGIPANVEHQVNLRDRGACRGRNADGTICGCTKWVHIHHIVPRSRGGKDVLENLITLCSAHHRLWHKREAKGHTQHS